MAKAKKLPSGNWRVLVYCGKDSEGKRRYQSFTHENKKEVEYMAAEYALNMKEIANDKTKMTFEAVARKYIELKKTVLSPSTIYGYEKMLRNNYKDIKNIKLCNLTSEIIQEWISSLTQSPKTVRNIHGFFSSVLHEYHPKFCVNTTLPQKERCASPIPTSDEAIKIIEAVKDTEIEIPVLFGLWLGLRLSEIQGIKFSDIENGIIHINSARIEVGNELVEKTTKSFAGNRKIKLPEYLLNLIDKADKSSIYIVTMSRKRLYARYKKMLKEQNLYSFRFHDLRHANASIMLAMNIPDKYAMERMGHGTNSTLKTVYQHTFSDERDIIDSKVNEYFLNKMQHEMQHKGE